MVTRPLNVQFVCAVGIAGHGQDAVELDYAGQKPAIFQGFGKLLTGKSRSWRACDRKWRKSSGSQTSRDFVDRQPTRSAGQWGRPIPLQPVRTHCNARPLGTVVPSHNSSANCEDLRRQTRSPARSSNLLPAIPDAVGTRNKGIAYCLQAKCPSKRSFSALAPSNAAFRPIKCNQTYARKTPHRMSGQETRQKLFSIMPCVAIAFMAGRFGANSLDACPRRAINSECSAANGLFFSGLDRCNVRNIRPPGPRR